MIRIRMLAALAAVALVAAACGDDGASETTAPTTAPATTAAAPATTEASTTTEAPATTVATTTTAAPTTTVVTTTTATMSTEASATTEEAPAEEAPTGEATVEETTVEETTVEETTVEEAKPAPEWELVAGTEDCACADGSEYSYWVREADPTKVVFYLEGGGACFSLASCSFTDGEYDVDIDPNDPAEDPNNAGGIFNFDNPLNPLRDYSFVAVPYCTGDVHIGNNTQDYGDGLVVRHNGFVNANTALAEAVRRFGDATEVVVAGTSAGSASAALYGGLSADAFPEAAITVVADASGAYPSIPGINATIGALWGTTTVVPDWPVNEGLTAQEWGLPELFIQAGLHAPRIRFARFDNAFDQTQEFFAALAGFDASRIDQLMAQNEARIEAAGVDQASYTAPGRDHGILPRDSLYTLEVEGVSFLDWLTALVSGEDVDDVTCTDCS